LQEFQQSRRLASGRAEMDIRYPDRPEAFGMPFAVACGMEAASAQELIAGFHCASLKERRLALSMESSFAQPGLPSAGLVFKRIRRPYR
jgi:hypothetical protein